MRTHSNWRLILSLRVLGVVAALQGLAPLCRANELDADRAKLVEDGAKLFDHRWQANDPISRAGDGLGPVYNERSCTSCHSQGGIGGAGAVEKNVQLLASTIFADRSTAENTSIQTQIEEFHPGLGTSAAVVFHRFGTSNDYATWRGSRFQLIRDSALLPSVIPKVSAEKAAAAADTTARSFKKARLKQLEERVSGCIIISERNPTALFGDGLIDQIPDAVIKAQARIVATAEPLNTTSRTLAPLAVPGRYVTLSDGRVGKFGWKAQQATLAEFTMSACAVEIGLEVPNNSQLPDPRHMSATALGLDMNRGDCDALVEYVNHLPAPRREIPADSNRETVMVGEALFDQIGCTGCHKTRLGDIDGIYSDLLVHDMGEAMSDSADSYGSSVITAADDKTSKGTPADRLEWRTPPLWGVADSAPYLHDGRAWTLKEAILLHDGQASDSADCFSALSDGEQASVVTFLRSLKAPMARPEKEMVTQAAPR